LGLFVGVVATTTIVGAGPLVRLTYGASFAPAASAVAWIGIGLVPFVANSSRKVYLYAAGRERIALVWSTVALAAQAIGCAVLASTFGARGAAAALAIGETVVWWPLRRAETETDLGPWFLGLGSWAALGPRSLVRPERTKN
jgi:O-antigen/teichoic acid export membrane protein